MNELMQWYNQISSFKKLKNNRGSKLVQKSH